MEAPSAFGAAYSDWKIIRTRGVIQIVFEVPIEQEGDCLCGAWRDAKTGSDQIGSQSQR
jgi:hypothetical protein